MADYPIPMAGNGLQALVLSHVAFEDLGSLRPIPTERGFRFARGFAIETVDAATAQLPLWRRPEISGIGGSTLSCSYIL
jgi:hypothetical protein